MSNYPVLAINLNTSIGRERKAYMQETFSNESVIWINGISALPWRKDKYTIKEDSILELIEKEILDKQNLDNCKLFPGEVGCALGHRKAWNWIAQKIKNDKQYVLVLEDDIQPTENYIKNFSHSIDLQGGIPTKADVLFLSHDGGFGCLKKSLDNNGKLIKGSGNYGYLMNRQGAIDAIEQQFPMREACDIQWRNDNMYVVKKPIIKMSPIGRISHIRGYDHD